MNGFCKTAGFAASRRSAEAEGRADTHRTFASGRAPRSGSKTANPPSSPKVARMRWIGSARCVTRASASVGSAASITR